MMKSEVELIDWICWRGVWRFPWLAHIAWYVTCAKECLELPTTLNSVSRAQKLVAVEELITAVGKCTTEKQKTAFTLTD